ncbi:putative nuclease HARBI1 [Amborella trichopoda]|uniref:putative nuclease HARBI1 n=1 Tax=Amborella trichopoda TaxID=13333 RepID=UPI0005D31DA3|nr:putative nuclease HARBI1 [Amborella trichopoda]XP_020524751.1 putative nuclease HARBI1 [Amborella trichopoda]XP_020524752.1 putative nuclease HARBI1 [Amborella trichopoda]XP_020524753.1 putative nuclease HARBI1 [Amborella trichopoda]XP_020524754.1 putative nuclease HARBI1 [Amborella trichopoda]|eukprot:XP_011624546.1 putative nuclease HARBI1 [Amborella trichopoda]
MDESDVEEEMELAAATVAYYWYTHMSKEPFYNSSLSGTKYVKEVLNGKETYCRKILRMDKCVFYKLRDMLLSKGLLRNTSKLTIEERLAIFLITIGHNQRNRIVQGRFQHSGETISRHFNDMLHAILKLSSDLIQLPNTSTPEEIHKNSKYFPYFKDCIGVVDGTHIPAMLGVEDQPRFRNRNGLFTQNVMAACSFDLRFAFVLAGWEGSAEDSHVLRSALTNGFQVPEGKYYLVNEAHSNVSGFMAPYQGVRYHLNEFMGDQLPQNEMELFNYRHLLLRNAIKCTFAVLRARFPILKSPPPYPYKTQVKLVQAACILHNLVHQENRNDWLFTRYESETEPEEEKLEDQPEIQVLEDASLSSQDQVAFALRDSIASHMWNDYTYGVKA